MRFQNAIAIRFLPTNVGTHKVVAMPSSIPASRSHDPASNSSSGTPQPHEPHNTDTAANNQSQQPLDLKISASRQFTSWLHDEVISLAFTTYQSQLLLMVGFNAQTQQLSVGVRNFGRAMGLYVTPDTERLYLSTKYQLWQLDNTLQPGASYKRHDRAYVPRVGYTTGDLDIHDVVMDGSNRPIFVCTLLNCLATVSDKYSCVPLWTPPFISKVVSEDRCHLNGLAAVDGHAKYVTLVNPSDILEGWRTKRRSGGCVMDVPSNEIVATGLSMPHSPRFYDGKLWLLNSGTGEFGYIDLNTGWFEPIAFCPGYLRGLAFHEHFAIVGLSTVRSKRGGVMSGLELDERLHKQDVESRCGLMVIDLTTGAIVHWLRLEGHISELYDVQVLSGVRRPLALGFQTDEISRLLTIAPPGKL